MQGAYFGAARKYTKEENLSLNLFFTNTNLPMCNWGGTYTLHFAFWDLMTLWPLAKVPRYHPATLKSVGSEILLRSQSDTLHIAFKDVTRINWTFIKSKLSGARNSNVSMTQRSRFSKRHLEQPLVAGKIDCHCNEMKICLRKLTREVFDIYYIHKCMLS